MKVEILHRLLGHRGAIYKILPGMDGQSVLSAGGDGWVARWSLDMPGDGILVASSDAPVYCAAVDRQSDCLLLGTMHGELIRVYADQREEPRKWVAHKKGIYAVCTTPDGTWWTAGGDGLISRWDSLEARQQESLQISSRSVRTLAYVPGQQLILAGSSDGSITAVDVRDTAPVYTVAAAHASSVFCLALEADGSHFLSGGRDAALKRWELAPDPVLIRELAAHTFTINDIITDDKHRWIFSASRDKTIRIWDARTLELLKVLDAFRYGAHANSVNCLFWDSARQLLLSGSDDRSICIWRIMEE